MKKKLSILIALVMAISLCLVPAAALAVPTVLPYEQTFGPSVGGTSVIAAPGDPNTVDVILEDTGDGWLRWTYTYPETPTFTPKMTVAIDYPNGFCITTFDDYHDGWYYAPDPDVEASRVRFADYAGGAYGDWAVTTASGNVLTVKIRKSALGLSFMWHGYANVNGKQVWIQTLAWQPQGEVTIDADLDVGLTGVTPQITAITVYPTSIDFGTITPGTPVPGDTITVTNIGTVSVVVSAMIDPAGGAFAYLYLNGTPKANGSWTAGQLGMATILPTLNASCTTELQVPVTYSAKGSESTKLAFIATSATP